MRYFSVKLLMFLFKIKSCLLTLCKKIIIIVRILNTSNYNTINFKHISEGETIRKLRKEWYIRMHVRCWGSRHSLQLPMWLQCWGSRQTCFLTHNRMPLIFKTHTRMPRIYELIDVNKDKDVLAQSDAIKISRFSEPISEWQELENL